MGPESVILLAVSAWLLVAAAMLWGMLRVVRRHAMHQQEAPKLPSRMPAQRKHPRPKRQRPALTPAFRAAHHFVHR